MLKKKHYFLGYLFDKNVPSCLTDEMAIILLDCGKKVPLSSVLQSAQAGDRLIYASRWCVFHLVEAGYWLLVDGCGCGCHHWDYVSHPSPRCSSSVLWSQPLVGPLIKLL